ncbi:MAG: GPP34 family phosphoprotein [Methylophilaceae bacterium]
MAEELLLITLDDESGKLLDSIKPFSFDIAIAASLIMELTLKGKLDTDAKKLFVVSSTETGDAILDQALTIIVAEKNSLSTSEWLSRFAHYGDTLSDKIIESLVNKGVVQLVEKRLLWVLKTRAYPATSGIEEREVRSRIMQLLNNDEIPNPSDALLIGLLRATGIMNRLLSSTELERLQNRIDQIANLEEINRSLSASVQEAWESIISQVPLIH